MISPNEAWQKICDEVLPLPVVNLSLDEAAGHVVARNICADRDIPAADRSAMDGYAVRSADVQTVPVELALCGEVAAGSDANPPMSAGECAIISTGGNVPSGADAVVMKEDTQPDESNNCVRVLKIAERDQHIFKQGENARAGDVLVEAGMRLESGEVGACAAVGVAEVAVYRKPVVSILCTGSELLAVASTAGVHQLRNSNGPMLRRGLQAEGMRVGSMDSVGDDEAVTVNALSRALGTGDVVILTGGVSVGRHDHVRAAIEKLGGRIVFHGIAMKPGKPQLFARIQGQYIFGLPGNPLSAMIGLYEFVVPALHRLSGLKKDRCRLGRMLPMAVDVGMKGDLYRYILGRVEWTASGPQVHPIKHVGSSDLVAGAKANGMLILPPGKPMAKAGELVEFRTWHSL